MSKKGIEYESSELSQYIDHLHKQFELKFLKQTIHSIFGTPAYTKLYKLVINNFFWYRSILELYDIDVLSIRIPPESVDKYCTSKILGIYERTVNYQKLYDRAGRGFSLYRSYPKPSNFLLHLSPSTYTIQRMMYDKHELFRLRNLHRVLRKGGGWKSEKFRYLHNIILDSPIHKDTINLYFYISKYNIPNPPPVKIVEINIPTVRKLFQCIDKDFPTYLFYHLWTTSGTPPNNYWIYLKKF